MILCTGLLSAILPEQPFIQVFAMNTVCETVAFRRDRFRYVSVVVNYTSSGSSTVGQFEFECSSTQWTTTLLIAGTTSLTIPADATFDTPLRRDCGLCASNLLAEGLEDVTIFQNIDYDNITHCFGKCQHKYLQL